LNNRDKYRIFCKKENDIPIFSKDWWLDTVCGENGWDVVFVESDSEIIASLPFYHNRKAVFEFIQMPILTQTLGPYIKYNTNFSYEKRLSFDKKIMNELIIKLPKFDYLSMNFHYSVTNWLPFYWNNFKQTTKYTYVLDDLTDIDSILRNFNHAKRKNIKKAEKIVTVKFDLPANDFYENHTMTLSKQNAKIEYDFKVFNNIYNACYKHKSGRTIYAVDEDNNIHAALFVIWDDNSAYDLISTIDPTFRNSGAASLLVYEMIKYVSDKTKYFDFEGSMIENVENSFRQFGAIQKPYFLITKTNSKILKLVKFLKEFK